ncbi:hypothetical protein AMTRI_Chr10g3360 [Amborella trichopoda]|uniref:Protein kinase domain-containing protein n=1 Tax=Amborella trichopoda TaxID=13333 RepID=W1PRP0_AMBTC|nr:probable inactive receptor kinase At1g27190 [Amborella trichopoda]ERN10693.1 hypothetical protein AMTR_s00028p00246730 [Amborella trichopoda]|eukprot:XP_006849112.1 probable inactive receptor kinase At1g27190 [Amborella trichopoda]
MGRRKTESPGVVCLDYHCISLPHVVVIVGLLLLNQSPAVVAEDDVQCLRATKSELLDPQGNLVSWNFGNTSAGFICAFGGVTCWHENENKVLDLRLSSLSLSGPVPSSLRLCSSMTSLDISKNSISGPIPANLCDWLPFLVTLDLSHNQLSGHIPPELVNCRFLNTLRLDSNKLSGQIPYQLASLDRLAHLSLSGNSLSGAIPSGLSKFDSSAFANNGGLCAPPVSSSCNSKTKASTVIIIAAAAFGACVSLAFAFGMWWWFVRGHKGKGKADGGVPDAWVEKLRAHRLAHVSMFQKPLVKIKLTDLLTATNDFDPGNVITSGKTGTSYRAVLADGSALAIKRIHSCPLSEKQFRSEMNRLGQLRHPNLVPLLGYCIAADEKLLVYKDMPSGTLYSLLHDNAGRCDGHELDWAMRLRIGVGAARGLAWLHHGNPTSFIHRNISSNTVLLDEDYEARITDFGLARIMSPVETHLSTFINGDFGDFGYVAPEYSSTLVASLKGDVYGFGVVLLELATGQKPLVVENAEEGFKGNLVEWVNRLSSSGRIIDAVDASLRGKGNDEEILQFMRVACACVLSRPKDRSSMHQVYQLLKGIGSTHDFSEQYDEFPLLYGRDDKEHDE